MYAANGRSYATRRVQQGKHINDPCPKRKSRRIIKKTLPHCDTIYPRTAGAAGCFSVKEERQCLSHSATPGFPASASIKHQVMPLRERLATMGNTCIDKQSRKQAGNLLYILSIASLNARRRKWYKYPKKRSKGTPLDTGVSEVLTPSCRRKLWGWQTCPARRKPGVG